MTQFTSKEFLKWFKANDHVFNLAKSKIVKYLVVDQVMKTKIWNMKQKMSRKTWRIFVHEFLVQKMTRKNLKKRLFLVHFLTHIPFQYFTFVAADFPRSTPCLIAYGKGGKADTRQSKFGTFARKVGGGSYYFKYTLNQTKQFNQKYLEIN